MDGTGCRRSSPGSGSGDPAAANTGHPDPGDVGETPDKRQRRRPQRRQLFCPAHPDQRIAGNGRKYFLHLLTPEELHARGLSVRRSRLVLQAYPVLVLSNEWLEELFCPQCGTSRWCHVTRHDRLRHAVAWAPRELWQQVAHVDPLVPNPSVSQFTRRQARSLTSRRLDARRLYDSG